MDEPMLTNEAFAAAAPALNGAVSERAMLAPVAAVCAAMDFRPADNEPEASVTRSEAVLVATDAPQALVHFGSSVWHFQGFIPQLRQRSEVSTVDHGVQFCEVYEAGIERADEADNDLNSSEL